MLIFRFSLVSTVLSLGIFECNQDGTWSCHGNRDVTPLLMYWGQVSFCTNSWERDMICVKSPEHQS